MTGGLSDSSAAILSVCCTAQCRSLLNLHVQAVVVVAGGSRGAELSRHRDMYQIIPD